MAAQQDEHPVPMEGRSRGPNIHSGGTQEIGAPVPPYEGRQTTGKDKEQLIEERISTDHDAGPRNVSQEEREGVSATDTSAASPLGVGESTRGQGNEEALGESEESRRAGRLETSNTGVGRSEPIDSESPNLQPGDQGG
ncbi:MAG: hypothetical protein ACRDTC_25305 [Pseudonocardiaceae bacterium]